jgi:hypothetical protein
MDECTCVVNVGAAHLRPRYRDLAAWLADSDNAYIGRAGVITVNGQRCEREGSIWGNPFKVNHESERAKRIASYRAYVINKINDEGLHAELESLRNKRLGCWCVYCPKTYDPSEPLVCHGQVLLELLHNGVPPP